MSHNPSRHAFCLAYVKKPPNGKFYTEARTAGRTMLKLFLDPYPVMQMYSYSYINMQVAERLGERDHLVPLFGHLECDTCGARNTSCVTVRHCGECGSWLEFLPAT